MPTKLTLIPTIGVTSELARPALPPAGFFVPYIAPDGSFRIVTHDGTELIVPLDGGTPIPPPTEDGTFLGVVDGLPAWQPIALPEGMLVPYPSVSDEGKFLKTFSGAVGWATPPASGGGGGGAGGQVVHTRSVVPRRSTSSAYENVPELVLTITPVSEASRIRVDVDLTGGNSGASMPTFVRLLRNGVSVGAPPDDSSFDSCLGWLLNSDVNVLNSLHRVVVDSPGTTNPVTYQVQCRTFSGGGAWTINRSGSDAAGQSFSVRGSSTLTATELL